MTAPSGPFEARSDVERLPEVRAAWAEVHRSPGQGRMREQGQAIIEAACQRNGVALGAHDRHFISWLAGIAEPEGAAVVADLIDRASARKPRTFAVALDTDAWHVLTEALEEYAYRERDLAEHEGGNDARDRWAATADRLRGLAEDAMDEPRPAAEGGQ